MSELKAKFDGYTDLRCEMKLPDGSSMWFVPEQDKLALTARIAELEKRNARLVEVGDKLAKHPYPMTDAAHIDSGEYCVYCHKSYKADHEDYCPVTLWNKEAHE